MRLSGGLRAALALAAVLCLGGPAAAACVIANSECYPWRLGAGAKSGVILENVPNNAVTSVIYRFCLCPPAMSVDIVFSYPGQDIVLGTLERDGETPLCRDFRIQTSRASQILVARPAGAEGEITGCYTALPAFP